MRLTSAIRLASAAAAFILLAGCASGSVTSPKPSTLEGGMRSVVDQRSVLLGVGMMKAGHVTKAGYRGASFDACPRKEHLTYVSDQGDGTVNIFAGNLHGQAPCGILTIGPFALNGSMVKSGDLYVTKGPPFPRILVFHRGETMPFMSYFDLTCGDEVANDVAVSDDGYVVASNIFAKHCTTGSISVWKKSTGAFVANYPSVSGLPVEALTIQKDGTVYYDDAAPSMWVGKCVKGVCGAFTNTGATFVGPGGIRSVDGEHVVLDDLGGLGGGRALTYTPPSFESPSGTCSFNSSDPVAIDINFKENHIFVADLGSGVAREFKYPTGGGDGHPCVQIGTVTTSGGFPSGIAVARPESL